MIWQGKKHMPLSHFEYIPCQDLLLVDINGEHHMDFLLQHALILWIAVACGCLALGTIFTVRDRRRQPAVPSSSPQRHTFTSPSCVHSVCRHCRRRTDDPGAHWCWFCGQPLFPQTHQPQAVSSAPTETCLVDLHTIDAEIQQRLTSS